MAILKAPTYEQVSPWANGFGRVAVWCCALGVANSLALVVVNPDLSPGLRVVLILWWGPVVVTNLIVQHVMLQWAKARLRFFEREHAEILRRLREWDGGK